MWYAPLRREADAFRETPPPFYILSDLKRNRFYSLSPRVAPNHSLFSGKVFFFPLAWVIPPSNDFPSPHEKPAF